MTGERILDGLTDGSKPNLQQFQDYNCDITQTFLLSVALTRLKKGKSDDPRRAFFDGRGHKQLNKDASLNKCVAKILTAMTSMHLAQSRDTQVSGPGATAIWHGLSLLLDGKGVNEKLLARFATEGISANANRLRDCLVAASSIIDTLDVRLPPPPGFMYHSIVSADNADTHVFASVISCIPIGDMVGGLETVEDAEHFDEHYISGLPLPSEEMAKMVLPTEADDEVAKKTILHQNILALINAMQLAVQHPLDSSDLCVVDNASEWSEGDMVGFKHRHMERVGTIIKVDGDDLRISYRESNGDDAVVIIPSREASAVPAVAEEDSDGDEDLENRGDTEDNAIDVDEVDDAELLEFIEKFRPGADDGGGRHKTIPSTTIIRDVLSGLSSKHHEAAAVILERVLERYGGEGLSRVITLVADQEFLPCFFRSYFASFHTDTRLPLLPMIAMGHGLKVLATSQLKYFSCIFDPLFKAQGIAIGSPAYNRIRNGRVIRDTVRWAVCSQEALRTALAIEFLQSQGHKKSIRNVDTSAMMSPFQVLEEYATAFDGQCSLDDWETVVCIDQHARPQVVLVTEGLRQIGEAFGNWVNELGGEDGGYYVGPSGYASGPPQVRTAAGDSIDNEVEPAYKFIQLLSYHRDGDEIGLLQRCKNAGIVDPNLPLTKEVLWQRYYLYYKNTVEKSEEEGLAAARAFFRNFHASYRRDAARLPRPWVSS